MKKAAIFVHGFNVSDGGEKSVDRLIPTFKSAGYDIYNIDYRFVNLVKGLLKARFFNDEIARGLESRVKDLKEAGYEEVVAIGHSNGCTIIHLAKNAPIDKIIYINPALTKYVKPNKNIKKAMVYYSPKDWTVWIGKWWSKIIPGREENRPWGEMGRTGWLVRDKRIINYNLSRILRKKIGHSDAFKDPQFFEFASHLILRI